jgi:hypothetical protein
MTNVIIALDIPVSWNRELPRILAIDDYIVGDEELLDVVHATLHVLRSSPSRSATHRTKNSIGTWRTGAVSNSSKTTQT